ncbi:hypothetical protein [Streptomyces sp. NPDC050560]|uniref:hypothetical protein n=1 Tax=Streptomyces sp. NPDC050560 TaxID=3365630 RepID=UPI0037A05884
MPDPSLRPLPLGPMPVASAAATGARGGVSLPRERRPAPPRGGRDGGDSAPGADGTAPEDDNPFAPPPEGAPDRPWEPRTPPGGRGEGGRGDDGEDARGRGSSPWGSQWSDNQPGRAPGGGFGDRPGRRPQGGPGGGPEGPQGQRGGPRWDPKDPAQRRARYALLGGMWAFFFALFGWRYPALLLGALALYWSISSLRAAPRTPDPTAPQQDPRPGVAPPPGDGTASGADAQAQTPAARAPGAPGPAAQPPGAPGSGAKPQTTAAVSGLVTAALALAIVAATFAAQLVYRDYYTCVNDALTNSAKHSCEQHLPSQLRSVLGEP